MKVSNVSIQRLDEFSIHEIVNIHRSVLGYSVSSRMGVDHLAYLYRRLSQDSNCYIGVAFIDSRPVGVISGAIDMNKARELLFKSYPLRLWIKLILKMITMPSLLLEFWKGRSIDRPVFVDQKSIPAILSTLAIHKDFQGMGIGQMLVTELEHFFAHQHVDYYRVDTYINNKQARRFYQKMHFQEIKCRANSVILIKGIQQ